jgi:hypothetical protein
MRSLVLLAGLSTSHGLGDTVEPPGSCTDFVIYMTREIRRDGYGGSERLLCSF